MSTNSDPLDVSREFAALVLSLPEREQKSWLAAMSAGQVKAWPSDEGNGFTRHQPWAELTWRRVACVRDDEHADSDYDRVRMFEVGHELRLNSEAPATPASDDPDV